MTAGETGMHEKGEVGGGGGGGEYTCQRMVIADSITNAQGGVIPPSPHKHIKAAVSIVTHPSQVQQSDTEKGLTGLLKLFFKISS
jgi:hypothetical protein